MDGEDGPGVGWSVGAIEVGADGPCELVRSVLDASSTSFRRDERKLGSPAESPLLSRALEQAAREDSPFCCAIAASSCGRLVRGRFNFRSGSVGSGDGERVGSLRFRAALGLFSISRALSNAFQARISSKDSGSGVGSRGARGRDGRAGSISNREAVSRNRLPPPCRSATSKRSCHARNSRWLASSRRRCCMIRSADRSSSKGKSRSRFR